MAVYYGEVFLHIPVATWLRNKGIIEMHQHTGWGEQSRPINVTGIIRTLRAKRLAKVQDALPYTVLVLTSAGTKLAEELCTASL